ncbi:hypothetical protein ACSAGD_09035 [Paramicrobacterium sp. CJ85]|uniref:hypothetical protein n=1 Tax=Paramicrobacterium sp. CJ85 TaxID=3445355 RepID=UPI003F5FEA3D
MSPAALALVLTAAVTHAAWNLAAGRSRADSTVSVWLYMTGSAIILLPLVLVQLASAG